MSQYWCICNITKQQLLLPSAFDEGPKLGEFGCSSRGTQLALTALTVDDSGPDSGLTKPAPRRSNSRGRGSLYKSRKPVTYDIVGSWCGDRIVTAGEYGPERRFLDDEQVAKLVAYYFRHNQKRKRLRLEPLQPTCNLYTYALKFYRDISPQIRKVLEVCGYSRTCRTEDDVRHEILKLLRQRCINEFREQLHNIHDLRWLSVYDAQLLAWWCIEKKAHYAQLQRYLARCRLEPWQQQLFDHAARFAGDDDLLQAHGWSDIFPLPADAPVDDAGNPVVSPRLSEFLRTCAHDPADDPGARTRIIALES